MSSAKRVMLTLPFVIACTLTLLSISRPLHWRHPIEVCTFLFAMPWAWLLDRGWFGYIQSRWAQAIIGYAILLWVPALLYSGCLWLLLRVLGRNAGRIRV